MNEKEILKARLKRRNEDNEKLSPAKKQVNEFLDKAVSCALFAGLTRAEFISWAQESWQDYQDMETIKEFPF